jgi:Holliday junction resolvase RusA-like endonuclease
MIKIKPLSVNQAWQGKRFKTPKYKAYENEVYLKLPKLEVPKGALKIEIKVYFKNHLSDIDNVLKPFLDILQKKYKFNDRDIYELEIKKYINKIEGLDFQIIKL